MREDARRGLFISLEGTDGAGKTTQLGFIKKFFENKGVDLVMTREPGGTKIGEKLREILLDKENKEMEAITEMMIYAAARAQHVRELIIPSLESGKVVVCDRYLDSSIAYQGFGRGLGEMVESVNKYAIDSLLPDLTILLDLNPKTGRNRILRDRKDCDRLELEKMDFHNRVYDGYMAVYNNNPDRIYKVDASRTIDEIRIDIENKLIAVCDARGI